MSRPELTTSDVLLMAGVIVFLAVAGLVGYLLARWAKNWGQRHNSPEPFTLQDLREMRERGEITPAEYDAMRGEILGRFHAPPADADQR